MRSLVVLAVVIVGVLCQDPCTVPNQFMTGIGQTMFDNYECESSSSQGMLYFDYPNQQLRVDEAATIAGTTYTLSVWLDYNKGMGYYYERDSDTCTSSEIDGELNDPQLPDDSDYLGTVLIGTQAVDQWLTPDDDNTGMYGLVSLAEGTCWPILSIMLNDTTNAPMMTQTFWDFIPQLPPFYFDIPDICMNARKVAEVPKRIQSKILKGFF